jgi:DNA-binding transcriptional ArsR family regulator
MTDTFDLLAEPTRRRIIEELGKGECPVNTLVARLKMSQPAVSKQLRVLRESGLALVRREGQKRIYRLDAEPLQELDEWLTQFRAYWQPRLDAMEKTLDSMED